MYMYVCMYIENTSAVCLCVEKWTTFAYSCKHLAHAYAHFCVQTNGPMSVMKYYSDPDALQIFTKIAK